MRSKALSREFTLEVGQELILGDYLIEVNKVQDNYSYLVKGKDFLECEIVINLDEVKTAVESIIEREELPW